MVEQRARKPRFFSRRRAIGWLIVLAIAILALAALSVTGAAERLFYMPSRAPFQTPPDAEDVRFPTTDGLSLHGLFIESPVAEQPAPTLLVAHGNAGRVVDHLPFVEFLPPAGFNVFLFDYRGYGRSDPPKRRLRRADLIDDVKAALDYLLTRDDVDADRIALFGLSLGGAVGLPVAAERDQIRALVLHSPFSTWRGVALDHMPLLPHLLIHEGNEPIDAARRLGERPVLILHGEQDRTVPPRHGRILADAVPNATLRLSDGAGHNDLFWVDPEATDAVAEFLRRALGVFPRTDSADGSSQSRSVP